MMNSLFEDVLKDVVEKSVQHIKSLINKTNNEPVLSVSKNYDKTEAIKYMYSFYQNTDKLQKAYELLSDLDSKIVFEWLLKTRIAYAYLGNHYKSIYPYSHISKLQLNMYENHELLASDGKVLISGYEIDSSPYLIHSTWIAEEYMIKNICEPKKNDIVLSAGAYYGETTIWFANKVGQDGKIYAFEPSETALKKLRENIDKNYITNVAVIPKGVYSVTGNQAFLLQDKTHDDANKIVAIGGNSNIETIKIDEFISENGIDRINFLKLDIEGAEYEALCGAKQTIKKYKPKIAVCIYHKPEDLWNIILLLHNIVPDYKFSIAHKSPGFGETVLFAYRKDKNEQ